MAAKWSAPPDRQTVRTFVTRVGNALNASDSFADACVEDRQRSTAAICLQTLLLHSAAMAARNLGIPELLNMIQDAARRTIFQTYGVDLDRTNAI